MNSNKIYSILITGIDGEVGNAVSENFKALGWKIFGVDIKLEEELKKAKVLDGYFCCDVTNRANLFEIVKKIEQEQGPINALFTAAQPRIDCTIETQCSCQEARTNKQYSDGFLDTSIEVWKEILDVWLKGTVNACAVVGPYMVKRKSGRIIILTPDYSKTDGDHVLDATAAGTLHGFIKSFGIEVAEDNVTVNGIFANVPFDLEAIAETASYLAAVGDYVSAQLISVRGKE